MREGNKVDRKTRVASPIALTFALTSVITLGLGGGVALADEVAGLQTTAGPTIDVVSPDKTGMDVETHSPSDEAPDDLASGSGVMGDSASAPDNNSGNATASEPDGTFASGDEDPGIGGDADSEGAAGSVDGVAGSATDEPVVDAGGDDASPADEPMPESGIVSADDELLPSGSLDASDGVSPAVPTFTTGWNRGEDGS